MKRNFKKAVCVFAAVLAACILVGCSQSTAGDCTLTLAKQEETVFVGKTVTLPAPVAKDAAGGDISDSVRFSVLFQDGSVYIPEHRYSLSPTFTAHTAGKYYAVYTVPGADGRVLAKETLELEVGKAEMDAGIRIDGVLDEKMYSEGYRTGVDGNLLFRYYFAKNGLLVGVSVTDTQIVYNDYLVSRLTQSDGFSICFNFSGEEGDRLNASCRKLLVGLHGEVYLYVPSEAKSFYELHEGKSALLEHALRIHGTKSAVGEDSVTDDDVDTGYVFEAFLPYEMLGVEAPGERIGIAFAHRDVASTVQAAVTISAGENRYFSSVSVPDGLMPILSENEQNYVYATYEAFAFTNLYHKLFVTGEQAGIVPVQTHTQGQEDK